MSKTLYGKNFKPLPKTSSFKMRFKIFQLIPQHKHNQTLVQDFTFMSFKCPSNYSLLTSYLHSFNKERNKKKSN